MTVPRMAQAGPYKVEVEKGKTYFWCTCGLSTNQPFCDGTHKGSGMKSFAWTAEKTQTVFLCGCKATHTTPFCDGTHHQSQE